MTLSGALLKRLVNVKGALMRDEGPKKQSRHRCCGCRRLPLLLPLELLLLPLMILPSLLSPVHCCIDGFGRSMSTMYNSKPCCCGAGICTHVHSQTHVLAWVRTRDLYLCPQTHATHAVKQNLLDWWDVLATV